MVELPFDCETNPRWRLLEAARDQLAVTASLDQIIAIVRASARHVVSADGVTFVLRDGNNCHYVDEDAIGPLWKGQKFPMASCISGWAMINSRTAVIPDVFADPRIPHDVYRKTFVKSMVMAPVGLATPVAAIGAYWCDKPVISEREVGAVEAIAAMVGAAMARSLQIPA